MAEFITHSRAETVALGRRMAGVLAPGTRAVCYPGMEGDLVKAGAVPCMEEPYVVDGHLITGRAAGSSFDFGRRAGLHRPGQQPHLCHRELLPGPPAPGPF